MLIPDPPTILDLPALVEGLAAPERRIFDAIYRLAVARGRLLPPPAMHPWIEGYFGRVEDVLEQTVLRVTNLVTLEETLFNPLRARRPLARHDPPPLEDALKEALGEADPLADPYRTTPEDPFGRVEGKYCVTASNIAKVEALHSLVVFREPHPLRFTREMVHDYLDTALGWAQRAHQWEPAARYFLLVWNCLWRSGASLPHGHAQMVLGRGSHYGQVEHLRRAALHYRLQSGRSYFQDIYRAHAAVGCALQRGEVQVLAHLTPRKEREALLMAPRLDGPLKDAIYDLLACYRDRLGVTAFNLVIYCPPLGGGEAEGWEGFPVVVRLLDRGEAANRSSDIGGMELYAASTVAADPLRLAGALREAFASQGEA